MLAIGGIIAVVVVVGLIFLLRSMGMVGQSSSGRERKRHSGPGSESSRSTGLN